MIRLTNVTKEYGSKTALARVNLELEKGKLIGVIGENGSGKSTLLKLIAGLNYPTHGEIMVNEEPVTRKIASQVAYLSELDEYYRFHTVKQAVEFQASQFPDFNIKKAFEMLDFMKLNPNQKLKTLSKGNRGRVKIVLALSRSAPVVLLDEPFSGLDPMVRNSIVKDLISFVNLEKQVVVITTHEIREVEHILDEVVAIRDGIIIGHHNVDDLRQENQQSITDWMTSTYE
jgi:ABC-2 type transport system ATP-binding protein